MKKRLTFSLCVLLILPLLVFGQNQIVSLPTLNIFVVFRRLGDIFFTILVLLAFLFVIWGGITIATAGGDVNKVESGKKMVIFALVGIAVGAVSFGLVNLFYSYLTNR